MTPTGSAPRLTGRLAGPLTGRLAAPLSRRLARPLAVAGAAAAAAGVLAIRDPRTATYVACPLHALTGLWCPGCGGIRALGALVHGDVWSALSSNVLVFVALLAGTGLWAAWFTASARGRSFRLPRPRRATVVVLVAGIAAFTILRNTPWGTWLAPA